MLDTFLEVACGRTKTAEAKTSQVELLRRLPNSVLAKLASGEEKLACMSTGIGGCEEWLQKFEGTPLMPQALEIAKAQLQTEIAQSERSREQDASYAETRAQNDELNVRRKMLDIELLEHTSGAEPEMVEEEEVVEPMTAKPPMPDMPPKAPKAEAPPSAEPIDMGGKTAMLVVPGDVGGVLGYGRSPEGHKLEGTARGLLGGAGGAVAGSYLGGSLAGLGGAVAGGIGGELLGSHLATKGMLDKKPIKKHAMLMRMKLAQMQLTKQAFNPLPEISAAAKGVKGFAMGAGRNIASAAQSGGVKGALGMAKSVGKDGLQMAGQYAKAKPMMAAGMAGAAGLGAGVVGAHMMNGQKTAATIRSAFNKFKTE